ncbi:MAG: lipoprotein [Comamonas sp.]
MLKATQILVRSIALVACAASLASLAACGQRGPLFLPTEAAAQGRATLPQTLGISSRPTGSSAVQAPVVKQPADADLQATDDMDAPAGKPSQP